MEQEIEFFSQKYDEYAKRANGSGLDFRNFLELYKEIEGNESLTDEDGKVIFQGIDINDSQAITKAEFMELIRAVKESDNDYLYKLIFRAFDRDRDKLLGAHEFVEFSRYCKKELSIENVNHLLDEKHSKGYTYPEIYHFLTEKDTDPNADPYDGKLIEKFRQTNSAKSSTCCILI